MADNVPDVHYRYLVCGSDRRGPGAPMNGVLTDIAVDLAMFRGPSKPCWPDIEFAQPPSRRGPMLETVRRQWRRSRRDRHGVENGPRVLASIGLGDRGRGPAELTFELRGGGSVTIPNVPGARVPVYEVFAEDAYRLDWFTEGLEAGQPRPSTSAATWGASGSGVRPPSSRWDRAYLRSLGDHGVVPPAQRQHERPWASGSPSTTLRSPTMPAPSSTARQRRRQRAERAHGGEQHGHQLGPGGHVLTGGGRDVGPAAGGQDRHRGIRVRRGAGLVSRRLGERPARRARVPRRSRPRRDGAGEVPRWRRAGAKAQDAVTDRHGTLWLSRS